MRGGRRRLPALLAAAALAGAAKGASVRGRSGSRTGDAGRPARPQREKQPDRRQRRHGDEARQHRALKGERQKSERRLERGSIGKTRTAPNHQLPQDPTGKGQAGNPHANNPHWWHANRSDEKDVPSSTGARSDFPKNGMQALSAGGGGGSDNVAAAGSNGQFAVFSLGPPPAPQPTSPPPTGTPTAWPTSALSVPHGDDPLLPPNPGPVPATTTAAPPGTTTTAAEATPVPTHAPTSPWPTYSPVAPQGDMVSNSAALSELHQFHPAFDHATSSVSPSALYSEGFEGDHLPLSGYFAWGARGNGQWEISPISPEESYDGGDRVATIGGAGAFAIESTLALTIGGGDGHDVDAATIDALRERGAYVTFGLKTTVGFPSDFLIFRVGATTAGYWNEPRSDWTTVTAYLPPLDTAGGATAELTWAYNFYPSFDGAESEGPRVMLDGVAIEAPTGDWELSDDDLYAALGGDGVPLPELELHHASAVAGWTVATADRAFDGNYVLSADTRGVIRAANPNQYDITTYHGTAVASFTVVTGPWGGRVTFSANVDVHTPIDVLEVGVDGHKIMAWVHPTSGWEEYAVDLDSPGKHTVTFVHVSNPTHKGMTELEGLGTPGASRVGKLRYTDNADPSTLTKPPTASPTGAPTGAPTPWSIPRQNYCAPNLASIADTCYTDDAITCNRGEGCPVGSYCYGNVDCHIPEAFLASLQSEAAPAATTTPATATVSTSAPQNYCGTNLDEIRATCASGTVPTCNDDDPPCPSGTYCWGAVECEAVAPDQTTTTTSTSTSTTQAPAATTGETIESFLGSFFGASDATTTEAPATTEAFVSAGCPGDLHPVEGMPGCCVPDPTFLGDGACDAYDDSPYNTAECFWDLGDCCRETCNPDTEFGCAAKEGDEFGPFGFYCLDSRYSTIDDAACEAANKEWIGDGGCDPEYNNAACGYDGGDCCRQTCDPDFAYYECGRDEQPFDCKDPDVIYRADYVP